ncbi:hypothetical protein [Kitasatospora sp. NPDC086791]|uniref:hypothetical protein n=1 Tax=Kitasatospora sp. NPDC086791 TaxID=3155178 RepID=UPI0034453C12
MDESHSDREITRNAPEGSSFRGGVLRRGSLRVGVLRGAREWVGWVLVALGALLCVLGWYGVSGERFVEEQVPYLASATIPGAALIVAGAVVVALRSPTPPGHGGLTDRRVERLYGLLVEPSGAGPGTDLGAGTGADAGPDAAPGFPDPAGRDGEGWLAVPEGTRYHRPDCPLVTGKARAAPVGPDAVRTRGLTPCPLCSPPPPDPDLGTAPGTGPDLGPDTRPGESAPPTG